MTMAKMMYPCLNANFVGNLSITQCMQVKGKKKTIPLKFIFNLQIIPRLQRMFASVQITQHITWYDDNKTQGILHHPSDAEA